MFFQHFIKCLKRSHGAKFGISILFLNLVMAIFAPYLAPYDPVRINLAIARQPPSPAHLLGTDELGRDMLSRIIYGSRYSLSIGLVSVSIGLTLGCVMGVIAGYAGGKVDLIIMRLVDIMLAFPTILLALCVVAIIGPGLYNAMIAVGITQIPVYARLVRSMVLKLKVEDYITASRAVGASALRIFRKHLLPNCMSPLLVQATLNIASAILSAASLGFLGLGAQPPTPEWGAMLSKGRLYMHTSPHIVVFPGLAIMVTVLGFNLLGDALRDAFDPKMSRFLKALP